MHEDFLGKESGNIVAMEIWLKQAEFRRLEFENGIPKRETVKCSFDIGLGGRIGLVVTDVLSIRYSTTGVHAFPVHPNVYDDIVNRLKKKNRQARFTASCRSVLIGFISNIQSFFEKVKRIMRKK